jgi:hypothetical protein
LSACPLVLHLLLLPLSLSFPHHSTRSSFGRRPQQPPSANPPFSSATVTSVLSISPASPSPFLLPRFPFPNHRSRSQPPPVCVVAFSSFVGRLAASPASRPPLPHQQCPQPSQSSTSLMGAPLLSADMSYLGWPPCQLGAAPTWLPMSPSPPALVGHGGPAPLGGSWCAPVPSLTVNLAWGS